MTDYQNLDTLAVELFRVFSRTEYALKASGFHKGDGAAEANWDNFALAVEDLVAAPASPALQEAINFILNAPPKKQVIVGGVIQWRVSEPQNNSQAGKLLMYVRRVRNNLFHGGKFNGHWFEPERSEVLLLSSLTILKACVEAVDSVREAYFG